VNLAELDTLQGTDDAVLDARENLPEPARVKSEFYQAFIPQEPRFYNLDEVLDISSSRKVFRKTLVVVDGASFWAWESLDDGKVYL
jgi:hypothetical protein